MAYAFDATVSMLSFLKSAFRGVAPRQVLSCSICGATFRRNEHQRGEDVRGQRPPESHCVVYIGSDGDLRKRLGDHLRGSSGNALLYGTSPTAPHGCGFV